MSDTTRVDEITEELWGRADRLGWERAVGEVAEALERREAENAALRERVDELERLGADLLGSSPLTDGTWGEADAFLHALSANQEER